MGSYQFIMIFLVVVIIAIGIAGAVAVIRQQGIEQEKKILDDLLFQVGALIYEHYLLPLSYGGYGKSVLYMSENENEIITLLPAFDDNMQEILSVKDGFTNKGFKIKMWPDYWQKFAIGVHSKTYNLQRWILVHCTSGQMIITSEAPVSLDFITQ